MRDIEYALADYRLTTAEIIYHLPDHPLLLQTYLWQEFDLPPSFPRLKEFLDFWLQSIEGKLHSVRVANAGPLVPNKVIIPLFTCVLH
jgi:uncharacterized protein Usg